MNEDVRAPLGDLFGFEFLKFIHPIRGSGYACAPRQVKMWLFSKCKYFLDTCTPLYSFTHIFMLLRLCWEIIFAKMHEYPLKIE